MPQIQIDIKTAFSPDLLKTFARYTQAVQEFYQKIVNGPGVTPQLAKEAEAFEVALAKANQDLQGVFVLLTEKILPQMTKIVSYANAWGTLFIESWKNGRVDELIGLTIRAGFEQARAAVIILWDSLKQLFTSDNFKLLAMVVAMEFTKGMAHAIVDVIALLGAAADYFCDLVAVGLLNAAVAMQNHLAKWLNSIPGFTKTFGKIELAEKSTHQPSLEGSLKNMQAGGQELKNWVDDFFNEGIAAARELWGKAGGNLTLGPGNATQQLKALLDEVLKQGTKNSPASGTGLATASPPTVGQEATGLKKSDNHPLTWSGEFTRVISGIQNKWGTLAKQMADTFSSVFDTAVSSISSGITGLIQGTKTWGQALNQIASTILNSVISAFAQMGVRYVMTKLMMSATDSLVAKKAQAENLTTAATGLPAGMAQAGAQGGWVGLAAFIALFVGGLAALSALTSSSQAREHGGPVLAGMPYLVGEKRPELFVPSQSGFILPRVPSMMDLAGGSNSPGAGGRSDATHFHFGIVDDTDAKVEKYLASERGQKILVNLNQRHARHITGRG